LGRQRHTEYAVQIMLTLPKYLPRRLCWQRGFLTRRVYWWKWPLSFILSSCVTLLKFFPGTTWSFYRKL